MASDYDSRLISDLYGTSEPKKAIEIINEMEDINNPIFLRPIYDAYQRFIGSFYSHYFLSAILSFDDKEALNIAIDAFASPNFPIDHLAWVLPIFKKYNFYSEPICGLIMDEITGFSKTGSSKVISMSYDIQSLLEYLKGNNIVPEREVLLAIATNENIDKEIRASVIRYWVRTNPKVEFQYVLDNYGKYIGTEFEILISKELAPWKNGVIEKLKDLIIKTGSRRAKEITEASREKEKKEETESKKIIKEDETSKYKNAEIISEIASLREKINTASIISDKFGFEIFPQNEKLIGQLSGPSDEGELRVIANDLRELIQSVSNKLGKHGCGEEEIKAILPDEKIEDYTRSLNKLFLYFSSQGIAIDTNIYGIRTLNRILNKLVHGKQDKKVLINTLKSNGLLTYYENEKWEELHRNLLIMYRDGLIGIKDSIAATSKELTAVEKGKGKNK